MSWRNSKKVTPEEPPFCLQSVIPTECPDGSEGDWYQYVIAQGANLITGMRAGEESEIRRELNQMVDRLNERRAGKNRTKTKPVAKKPDPAQTSESHA